MARLRSLARTAIGLFPLTPGGMALVALGVVALWPYGLDRQDLVLLTLGVVALAVAAIGLVSTGVAAVRVWLRVRRPAAAPALDLECGLPGRTGFAMGTPWYAPFTAVRWTWDAPRADLRLVPVRGGQAEQVAPLRRGEHEAVVRRFSVGDAFGVARVAFSAAEPRRVRFVPHTGGLDAVHVVQGLAGGDALAHPEGTPEGDPYDTRHYGAGDPIRFVLWKVFARTRQLVMRTPERALSPMRRTVAYLVAGNGDEAAAGAARVAVERGALGEDWAFGADGSTAVATTRPAALDLIVRSAETAPADGGLGLARFLEEASRGTVRRAVVFVPAWPGPWLDRVLATSAIAGSGVLLDVVVCVDGIATARRWAWLARLFVRAPEARRGPSPIAPAPLRQVLRRLSGMPGRLVLVDRSRATVHPASHLLRLLAG